ncbi:hypothetical protein [Parasitella parasitica]|uniref:Choice-of-anchor A domain-containing protein n=1 Tax=Parasitella parasitica TaxID=35722 RepID=A0A0B7NQZ2_9FUNG|nr:hypothetical protein [Parasitella parasitica]
MKRLLLFAVAASLLNEILCAVGKIPLTLEKDILCQSKELNYWNAIVFKDFKANTERGSVANGMDGPLMVGSDLAIDNYYINSKGRVNCTSLYNESVPLAEYGLYMNRVDHHTKQSYQIKDAIISGSIQVNGHHKHSLDSLVRPMQSCRLLVNSPNHHNALSMSEYENTAKRTSLYFASQNATHVLSKEGNIKPLQPHKNDKYYYFNFGSCQNSAECNISEEIQHLSHPSAFAQDQQQPVQWPVDKPIILNIPVARHSTFRLTGGFHGFTSKLPACNTIWNFFTVDEDGVMDESSEQSFTVTRNTDNVIGGTFLMPYGNVVDGSVGGFAGQLVAANYESRGASLYDFGSLDSSCHATSASCWPYMSKYDVDDAVDSKEEEKEEKDYLEWTIRKGRKLLPISNQGSGLFVDEINSGVASAAITVAGSLSMSSEHFLASQASFHPQNFLDVPLLLGVQEEPVIDLANPEEMEARLGARPAPHPEMPMGEILHDLDQMRGRSKTTHTMYIGTMTRTHHVRQVETTTMPFTKVKTVYVTSTYTDYTDTIMITVEEPHALEARPTGVSFDLIGNEIVTLY